MNSLLAFLILFSLMLAAAWVPAAEAAPAQAGPFVMNFRSQAARDGYIEESSETSSVGGVVNSVNYVSVGDSNLDGQLRGILSFYTAGLPDNATITQVQLKIKRNGGAGANPFTTHGNLIVDIRSGFFGTSPALQAADWQAARQAGAGTVPNTPVSNWYTSNLNSASFAYVNRTGTTQFRLRFQVQDNDDLGYDTAAFWAGESLTANRPLLTVTYTTP